MEQKVSTKKFYNFMEQKNMHSTTFIQYAFLLVSFLGLVISLVYIQNFLNMVSLQNEVIISLLRDIKNTSVISPSTVIENRIPIPAPASSDNTVYYIAAGLFSLACIGVVCYFLFNSKPKPTPSDGSSTSPTPSDGVNENSEKFTKIDLDFEKISQERAEILSKLNEISERSGGTIENVNTIDKINTLIDNQTANNSAIGEVTTINLEFINKAIGVFGELKNEREVLNNTLDELVELTNDRKLLDTTLKELGKRQAQLTTNQVDLTESQDHLVQYHAAMENVIENAGKITLGNTKNITTLANNAKIYADDLASIKESCKQILKLCADHFH